MIRQIIRLETANNVGNRLDFHNQSSVWPNRSMIIIGSRDAVLKISANWRRHEEAISTVTPSGIEIKICQMSTELCVADIVTFALMIFYNNKKYDKSVILFIDLINN